MKSNIGLKEPTMISFYPLSNTNDSYSFINNVLKKMLLLGHFSQEPYLMFV